MMDCSVFMKFSAACPVRPSWARYGVYLALIGAGAGPSGHDAHGTTCRRGQREAFFLFFLGDFEQAKVSSPLPGQGHLGRFQARTILEDKTTIFSAH